MLVAGGFVQRNINSAELYDPASGTWATTGSPATARIGHTATLLPNGKVLVAGGNSGALLASAELYDPASGTWAATGSLVTARICTRRCCCPTARCLSQADLQHNHPLASAELYDPTSGTWTATGSLVTARYGHKATLLPDGEGLVAGGVGSSGDLASAELYDPASGTWSATGSLTVARDQHTATLLPNGKVLVAAGQNSSSGFLASAELYDPASGTWTATGSLTVARTQHTATLLPNGEVLVAAGLRYLSARSFTTRQAGPGRRPAASPTRALITPRHCCLTARCSSQAVRISRARNSTMSAWVSAARGNRALLSQKPARASSLLARYSRASQASGGTTQDSSSNYPIVQLRSIDNSQVTFLPVDPVRGWSDTSFRSTPVRNFPLGPALVTVFTNGIPSTAKSLVIVQRSH